jgi:hypothetical protein
MKIKKTVYTQPPETARERGEFDRYLESNKINTDCAKDIYKSIAESNYAEFHYNLKDAAKMIAEKYGVKRMAWVIANTIQYNNNDGRFSRTNKNWANGFEIPSAVRITYLVLSHPCLVDGFADETRKLCAQKEIEAKLARAAKKESRHADKTAGQEQNNTAKPTLKERLENGKRKAEQHEKPDNTQKTKNREGIE